MTEKKIIPSENVRKDKLASGGDLQQVNKERYDSLDGLRALACVGIVLMHIMANIAVKPTESWLTTNIIGYTGNFVLLFMMVSAFSMSCGYYTRFKEGSISLNSFYKKRYMRVLPFFALLVVVDVIMTFAKQGFALTQEMAAELYEAYADLTLAFGFMPDADISVVGVGWFLGVIFLFYMLYPFFTFLIDSKRRAWLVFAVAVGLYFAGKNYFQATKGISFGSTNILYCAPYFIVGGIVYLYRKTLAEIFRKRIYRNILSFVTIVYTMQFFFMPEYRIELVSGLTLYALWLLYAVAESCSLRKWTLLNNRATAYLSGVSMEVYLCHMMFFRVASMLHMERFIGNGDFLYVMTVIVTLLGAICFSHVVKYMVFPMLKIK